MEFRLREYLQKRVDLVFECFDQYKATIHICELVIKSNDELVSILIDDEEHVDTYAPKICEISNSTDLRTEAFQTILEHSDKGFRTEYPPIFYHNSRGDQDKHEAPATSIFFGFKSSWNGDQGLAPALIIAISKAARILINESLVKILNAGFPFLPTENGIGKPIPTILYETANQLLQLDTLNANLPQRPVKMTEVLASEFLAHVKHDYRDIEQSWYINYQNLFSNLNEIAGMKYEGKSLTGEIVLIDQLDCEPEFTLVESINFLEHRKVRKLLEISNKENLSVLINKFKIVGLGKVETGEAGIRFRFTGHNRWEYTYGEECRMVVNAGRIGLKKERYSKKQLFGEFDRVFAQYNKTLLGDMIEKSLAQEHGTMLVFSTEAKGEAERLKNSCFQLKPVKSFDKFAVQLTSIDGAVLLDSEGICYSIGTILDGIVGGSTGSSGRGARFNSAHRYIEYRKAANPNAKIVIVIISEDGMVNFATSQKV